MAAGARVRGPWYRTAGGPGGPGPPPEAPPRVASYSFDGAFSTLNINHPRSSHGISKVAGFHLTRNYREAYGMHASGGLFFRGFAGETDFNAARKMLISLDVVELGGQEIAVQSAKNHRTLLRLGVTVRKTIDTVIATRCIESGYDLLHNDRDFDPFAKHLDLVHKKQLTVGKSKTVAGTGRVIPLNDTVMIALEAHAAWYIRRFGECKPGWYVFAAGKGQPNDPTRPVTTLRTAWTKVRKNAKVVGRWHDNRHTLVTELAESGAGDEVIMSIAGHVSRAMLSRYSYVRMEAKRRALDEIAARQKAADEKRQDEAERRQQVAVASQATVVQ